METADLGMRTAARLAGALGMSVDDLRCMRDPGPDDDAGLGGGQREAADLAAVIARLERIERRVGPDASRHVARMVRLLQRLVESGDDPRVVRDVRRQAAEALDAIDGE